MTIPNLQTVADKLCYVDDFPKPSIRFFDFESVLEDATSWQIVVDDLVGRYRDQNIDFVVGLDARGFWLAGVLAYLLGCGAKQARKPGKLPGEIVSVEYQKEYGTDTITMEDTDLLEGKRVIIVDDLLATGGTLAAAVELVRKLGGIVIEAACVFELPELKGRTKLLDTPIYSQISIIDNEAYAGVRYCVDPMLVDINTGEMLLIERLSAPLGIAMAGGGIEPFESVSAALEREIMEETGCVAKADKYFFHCVLTGADRDPRGVQVSYVFLAYCETANAKGEAGKTKIQRIDEGVIPKRSDWAFDDHYKTVSEFMIDTLMV